MTLRLGNSAEHVTLEFPAKLSIDPFAPQDSWTAVRISVSAGPWTGAPIEASFTSAEAEDFLKQLPILFRDLKGKVSLDTLEGWIKLDIQVDVRGGVKLDGYASDNNGTKIEFEIDSDQSYFSAIPELVDRYL